MQSETTRKNTEVDFKNHYARKSVRARKYCAIIEVLSKQNKCISSNFAAYKRKRNKEVNTIEQNSFRIYIN